MWPGVATFGCAAGEFAGCERRPQLAVAGALRGWWGWRRQAVAGRACECALRNGPGRAACWGVGLLRESAYLAHWSARTARTWAGVAGLAGTGAAGTLNRVGAWRGPGLPLMPAVRCGVKWGMAWADANAGRSAGTARRWAGSRVARWGVPLANLSAIRPAARGGVQGRVQGGAVRSGSVRWHRRAVVDCAGRLRLCGAARAACAGARAAASACGGLSGWARLGGCRRVGWLRVPAGGGQRRRWLAPVVGAGGWAGLRSGVAGWCSARRVVGVPLLVCLWRKELIGWDFVDEFVAGAGEDHVVDFYRCAGSVEGDARDAQDGGAVHESEAGRFGGAGRAG